MRDLLQQEIKGYKLVQLIGSGGFGAVYRAHQASVDREVAIKVILPDHANNPKFIRNFDSEAHLIARLEHPYVVPLFDYWREPNGAYIVMRYYAGGSLSHKLLNEGPLSVEDTARILDQIASALDAAHRKNIIHRDIKPANIMLDKENNAYLGDFGLAKNLADETDENRFVGSPAYVPPEVIMRKDADRRSDIYSLGFVMYEMLTGRYAYVDVTPPSSFHNILDFHLNEPVPAIPNHSDSVNTVLQRATAKDPEDRYSSAGEFATKFREALEHDIKSHVIPADVSNPYKGLRAFAEADANTFFGRDVLVRRLIDRMEEDVAGSNFLALVGPSGSGKSSTVYAGLLPALRDGYIQGSENWFIADMLPGAEPIKQLTAALRSVATKQIDDLEKHLWDSSEALRETLPEILHSPDDTLLLVIDHFEELFTQTSSHEERRQFLELLYEGLKLDNLRVLVLLRADFYDRPMLYEGFGSLIQARTEVVLPLNSMELNNVIAKPAELVGLTVQPELTAAMVADVREELAALPLLQYALTEMFEHNDKSVLTLEAYQAIGGVAGALAHRADEIYATLSPPEQRAARQIFLRLVTLGEGMEDTRRRAKRSELLSVVDNNNQMLQSVLDTFGTYRLLTFDNDEETREPTVEVAHEALIREWQQLRQWLDANRNDIRQQRAVYHAALEWQQAEHDTSYLLRGSHLTQLIAWSKTTRISLNDLEDRYLRASINEMERETTVEANRQQHESALEEKSRQRLRYLVFVLASAAVIAFILTGFALRQTSNARIAQSTSESNAAVALTAEGRANDAANEVSTQAVIAQENADAAALQADEARRLALAAVAQEALLQGEMDTALAFAMEAVHIEEDVTNEPPNLAISTLLQVAHAPGLIYEEQVLDRPIEHIAISPDGKYALLAVGRNQASYWGFQPQSPTGNPPPGAPPGGRPPQPNLESFAIVVWDIEDREVFMSLIGHQTEQTDILFLPPTANEPYRPVSVSSDGTLIFWDWASEQPREVLEDLRPGYLSLSLTENGATLLVTSGAIVNPPEQQRPGQMALVDVEATRVIRRIPEQHDNLLLARITPDGRYIVSLYLDGTHIVWDIENEHLRSQFNIPREIIRHPSVDMQINPDSLTVATNTGGTDVILWEVETGDRIGVARAATTLSHRIDFNADGSLLLMMSRDALLSIWAVDDNYLIDSLRIGNDNTVSLAMSANNETALFGTTDGILRVYAVISQPEGLITTFEGDGFATSGVLFQDEGTPLLLSQHPNHPIEGGDWLILWDVVTGEPVSRFVENLRSSRSPLQLSISPDGAYIMGVSDTGLQLWDMEMNQALNCFFCAARNRGESPMDAVFIPESGLNESPSQVIVEQGNILYVWNIGSDNPRILNNADVDEITELDVSSDGSTVLILTRRSVQAQARPQQGQPSSSWAYTLLWLDIETGNIFHSIEIDNPTVITFVPDSLSAAVAMTVPRERDDEDEASEEFEEFEGDENTPLNDPVVVVIFDPLTATSDARFFGHENEIRSIRFSSDGQRMVTGSTDQNAIVWDVETGTLLHTIFEESVVRDAMFTLDDTAILTIIEDSTPGLWRSTPFTLDETIAWAIENRSARDPVESECRRYQIEAFCNAE